MCLFLLEVHEGPLPEGAALLRQGLIFPDRICARDPCHTGLWVWATRKAEAPRKERG